MAKAKLPSFGPLMILCAVVLGGCQSGAPRTEEVLQEPFQTILEVDVDCRLARVGGDSRGIATDDGRVVLVGEGLGIVASNDLGHSYERLVASSDLRWPSIATDGRRIWVATVRVAGGSRATVAALGDGLGMWVTAFVSPLTLIDTELVVLSGGELLLFVTEVSGPVNSSTGAYTVHCLVSLDGGLTWAERSTPIVGPRGINIEDPRAVVLARDSLLLALEWESAEGQPSEIRTLRSNDRGVSWIPGPELLGGIEADLEPGGFSHVGEELWFAASSDEGTGHASYRSARIKLVRSADDGASWSRPQVLVAEPGQLSMGIIALDSVVLAPSLREYDRKRRRYLAVYRIDPIGRWRVPCSDSSVFLDGFEDDLAGWNQPRPKSP